jgi:hypothetical protein
LYTPCMLRGTFYAFLIYSAYYLSKKKSVNHITAATSASTETRPGSCEDSSLVQTPN